MAHIHPTAVVDKGAELGADVEIGPYCVIGGHVRIGDGTRLMSHVVVDGHASIGSGCRLFPFACIGTQTQDLKFRGAVTYVEIGDRTTLREYVTVNSGTNEGEVTRVGARCHIMAYSHVAHACNVGTGVIMANYTGLAGDVTVEDHAVIGGLVGVHQFVRVGTHCIIGGMSKINQDCPPYMMTDGNPATVRGLNSVGLKRHGISDEVQLRLKRAYKLLYRRGLSFAKAIESIRAEIEPCPEVDRLVEFVESSKRGLSR